ncbi:LSU ribosomal protein L10P [Cyclonatronum proteinivorum]|uniref:Large ribosomal subunit protein uL10 n=1 Tax=Cyclonatronum proteinivorum TaxID=1457365 RepID=A0A345UII6_9BACT|nr:50S ribosomal protein L10 [Cyclonatronum proteinivorum]AXJ00288.1 LSU ribosomal protein L10P [Cyclonatronum proteinivorum]
MATLAQKKVAAKEILEVLKESDAVYLAEYTGMTVAEVSNLRREFKKDGITYKVFKNTMVKRAMDEVGGYEDVYPYLENQTAFMFASGNPSKPAKILKEYLKSNKKPLFKAAYIDGVVYGESELDALSSMKSKEEVIGDIMGLLMAPITNVVGALQAQGGNIVGALKTIAEKEN